MGLYAMARHGIWALGNIRSLEPINNPKPKNPQVSDPQP